MKIKGTMSYLKAMSIKKIKKKDLELEYLVMVTNNMPSTILIKCMAAARLKVKMAIVIGGNSRSIRRKDMVQSSLLVETLTWGNSCRIKNMVMEYTDGQMEVYIMDNLKKVTLMAMDTNVFRMVVNIMDSTRMITVMEKEL
jgi:hypothetical protein